MPVNHLAIALLLAAAFYADGPAAAQPPGAKAPTRAQAEARERAARDGRYGPGSAEFERQRRLLAREFPELFGEPRDVFGTDLVAARMAALESHVEQRYIALQAYAGGTEQTRSFVQSAQIALNEVLDVRLAPDGALGPRTREAILRFQRENNIATTGRLDRTTSTTLGRAAADRQRGLQPPPINIDVRGERLGSLLATMRGEVPLKPSTLITLTATETPEGVTVEAVRGNDKRTITDPEQLRDWLTSGTRLVHEGAELSEGFSASLDRMTAERRVEHVRLSAASRNRTPEERDAAARLLNEPDVWGRVSVFNGLPGLMAGSDVEAEAQRMGLPSRLAGQLQVVNVQLRGLLGDPIDPATGPSIGPGYRALTKDALRAELRSGNSHAIVIYAHSEEGRIRLPNEEVITRADILALSKEASADRAIVWYACECGSAKEGLDSFAAASLQTGVAKATLAPEGLLDARPLPGLILELMSGKSLNEVFRWSRELEGKPLKIIYENN